jgi:HAD superfamily hydrolase (TIGR01450 family)
MFKDLMGKDITPIKNKKLFLFDMDGTIYRENQLFDGIKELFDKIVSLGADYAFITNNPTRSVKDYLKKVSGMGIACTEENFFTSAQAAAMLMKNRFSNDLIYAQGTRSFIQELKDNGVNVTEKYGDEAKCVLVAFDTELTAEKLRTTCEMLTKNQVEYYATNPDWVCPVDFGYIPDCGSMCFGIEKATGKTPNYIGKPQPTMINCLMQKFGASKEETIVIGDRIYTDIASGVNAGVDTVLVLSGEATYEDYERSEVKPTYLLYGAKDML